MNTIDHSKQGRLAHRAGRRRGAFTLVELLVVIGIILVLASFIMPAAQAYFKRADRTRTKMDIQAIATALDAYRDDFNGMYPIAGPISSASHDQTLLTKALFGGTGPTNAGFGNGFRMVAGGRQYGPYLQPDKFTVVGTSGVARIADRNGTPFQYLPRDSAHATNILVPNAGPAVTTPPTTYMFDSRDTDTTAIDAQGVLGVQVMLGDDNLDNTINGTERLRYTGPYLLISAGPDKKFLSPNTTADAKYWGSGATATPWVAADKTDDVYNFDRY